MADALNGANTQAFLKWRSWSDIPTTACLVVTMGYVFATSGRMVLVDAAHLPFWDRWQELLPERYLSHPFSQHNEHRIFIGRLFFALDSWIFGGRDWLCEIVTLTMLVGTAVLIAFAAARGGSLRRVFLPTLALGVTCLVSAYAWENLLYGFQVSFVGVLPLAVGAFVAMGSSNGSARPLGIAALCSTGAASSISSGILAAPMCVVYAALVGRPRRQVVALTVVAALVIAFYLAGYDAPGHHANPAASILRPGAVIQYVAAYLGAPFTWNISDDRVGPSRWFGYAGLAAWIASCALALRRPREASQWTLPFVMSYAAGTAALTALGRLNFPPAQALESRYGSTAFVFWIALAGQSLRCARDRLTESTIGVLSCAAAIGVARGQGFEEAIGLRRLEPLRPAETALLAGALEKRTVDRISPAPYLVVDALPELRKRRLSVFHTGWVSWIGASIDRFIRKRDDAACTGFLDRAFAVPAYGGPAFRVEGWAYSLESDAPLNRVVFIDENNIVMGFGLTGVKRPDVLAAPLGVRDEFVGFEGHIGSLGSDDAQVTAVALLKGRVGCWLKSSRTVHQTDAMRIVVK